MPVINLDQGPQTLLLYDVVGQRTEGHTHFVTHVGFYNADNQTVKSGDELSVVHMGPPLEQEGVIKVSVAGRVPFTNDEIKEISCWTAEIIDEYKEKEVGKRSQYFIHPPWKDQRDSNNGSIRYRRYSCVGFVLDSHRQVEIELMQIEKDALPNVERPTIISAYPIAERKPEKLNEYGLEGDGPWKVVLPGYVLHALNRSTDQIRQGPYRVKEGDEHF